MFIDTHCHLNFKAFEGGAAKIVKRARDAGVTTIIIPGTDLMTSQTAVGICREVTGVYAAIGIHPHHIYSYLDRPADLEKDITSLKTLHDPQYVVAIGEIGLDRHMYRTSKYGPDIAVSEEYFELQKQALQRECGLAQELGLSIIIHNRESTSDLIDFFTRLPAALSAYMRGRLVLHCCEADLRLLELARQYDFFIGIDGDITFDSAKQAFIKQVELERLVLETDAPYILPEPYKSLKKYPNLPAYIPDIARAVAEVKGASLEQVAKVTTENALRLYDLPK